MRLFGGERIRDMIDNMNMPDDEPLEHKILTRSIESAQKKVEGNNFAIRKHVLQYDDVMNKQREVIYGERRKVLEGGENLREHILGMTKKYYRKCSGNVYYAKQISRGMGYSWTRKSFRKYILPKWRL